MQRQEKHETASFVSERLRRTCTGHATRDTDKDEESHGIPCLIRDAKHLPDYSHNNRIAANIAHNVHGCVDVCSNSNSNSGILGVKSHHEVVIV